MSPKEDPSAGRLVYSTLGGRVCAVSGSAEEDMPQGDGVVRVRAEKKGRRGKVVTTVTGVPLKKSALKTLARDLRKHCGSGGTVKNGVIEVQGDFVDALLSELRKRGFTVKRAGG
ncbi:translation initiation factor [Planctomycetota bacterium]